MSNVIRTPVDTINILGAGGINQGVFAEFWGPEKSGKSTFSYQTASMFQRDNPDAVVHIIDVECSTDLGRLEHVFKMDMERIAIHNIYSLEESFAKILECADVIDKQRIGKFKDGRKEVKVLTKDELLSMDEKDFFSYCEGWETWVLKDNGISVKEPIRCKNFDNDRSILLKKLALAGGYRVSKSNGYATPVLIIWDTIACSRSLVELSKIEEGNLEKNAAGMGIASQVISKNMAMCLAKMGGKPLTCFILNQVRLTDFGSYTGPKETSYGSNALKHNCHYRFRFKRIDNKDTRESNYNKNINGKVGTNSTLSIEKSKFCPITEDIEIYINDQLGGIIVPKEELAVLARDKLNLITGRAGWYEFTSNPDMGKFRWEKTNEGDKYISNNSEIRSYLIEEITRHYRRSYFTLDLLYKDVGLGEFGKPSEKDLLEQSTIDDQNILNDLEDNPFRRS